MVGRDLISSHCLRLESRGAGYISSRVPASVDPAHLVGAWEIAERLGISHAETVHTWRRRHSDFPQPVAKLRRALVWNWPDVEAWARRTGRLR